MHRTILFASVTLFLASTLAIKSSISNKESRIDWCAENDDECLCNKINL
jgi:hypothetical protein